jgi:choline dehydrogenase-like flavoprotein
MLLLCSSWVFSTALLSSLVSGRLLGKEQLKAIHNTEFDYIILGGGTAGLVIASRLSEDPEVSVAVIEAGDFERNNPNVTNATTIGLGKNTRIDWQYDTVPQAFADNETSPIIWSAGKGVGGSTLINGKSSYQPSREDVNLKP